MTDLKIRLAEPSDAPAVSRMLKGLADHLGVGDVFVMGPEQVLAFGFGAHPLFRSVLATDAGKPVALALFFPHFSTYRGQPGAYVQDLWVDPQYRSAKLGERLLAAVAQDAFEQWRAAYVALAVHIDNRDAVRFYHRLGFHEVATDRPFVLDKDAFERLRQTHVG